MKREYLIEDVRRLRPGEMLEVDWHLLDFPSYEHNGATFTPQDQMLENIPGSAYEFCWHQNYRTRGIIFERLVKTLPGDDGVVSYVSPDRVDFYDKLPSGLYRLKQKGSSDGG